MRRGALGAALAALATIVAPSIAETEDPPAASPIDLESARAFFAEAKALSDADDRRLWGRRLYGPIMFVHRATRSAVANVHDDQRRLRPVARGESGPDAIDLHAGTLPPEVSIGNTTIEWGGMRWTMVEWPPPQEPTWRGSLLMHECFHRIQRGLGIPLAVPENAHLDAPEGRRWLRLEARALAAALEAEPGTAGATQAAGDAIAFRRHRHAIFGTVAAEEERSLELNEGLAEYTGLRLGGAPAPEQRKRAIAGLVRLDHLENQMRTFAYATGPAYGLLLDEAQPAWPRRVRKGSALPDLLVRAAKIDLPGDLAAAAEARAARYGDAELRAEEDARAAALRTRADADRARYVDGPTVVIDLLGDTQWSFEPHGIHALESVGSVYAAMEASGPWGILKVAGGVLMTVDDAGRRRLFLPAPRDGIGAARAARIEGDGWTLDVANGWRVEPGPREGGWIVVRR